MQSKNQRNFTSADVVEAINQSDIAWFQNLNPIISTKTTQNYNFEALNNIESQTIERYHKKYMNSNGDPKFRYVNIGLWTADLKKKILMPTADLSNENLYRILFRGNTHKRPRPNDEKRFCSSGAGANNSDPLIRRNIS